MAAVEMYWAKRTPEEVITRAQALAEVLVGQTLNREGLARMLTNLNTEADRWIPAFAEYPELRLRYIPRYDELWLINLKVIDNHNTDVDIGEKGAVDLASKYLEALADGGLVNQNHYNLDNAQIGFGKVGGGAKDGSESYEKTVEYRITLRREINGIQLANAGIRLSIHASGALTGIRIGGVSTRTQVVAGRGTPIMGQGKMITRRVTDEEVESRFSGLIPSQAKAEVAWSRLMYVMPEGQRKALVEPMQIYSYSPKFLEDGGEAVASRRKMVGFSVSDPKAAILDFTASAREHEGQNEERMD